MAGGGEGGGGSAPHGYAGTQAASCATLLYFHWLQYLYRLWQRKRGASGQKKDVSPAFMLHWLHLVTWATSLQDDREP